MKIPWGAIKDRLWRWIKKEGVEEAEEELRRRLGRSKTTEQSDTNPSSMTRPERDPRA